MLSVIELFKKKDEDDDINNPIIIIAIIIFSVGVIVSLYAFYYVYQKSKLPNRFPSGPRTNYKKNPIQSGINYSTNRPVVSLNFINNASKLNRRPTKINPLNQYRRFNK
jgi:hypothetical protein